MSQPITAQQMREIERQAIESGRVTGLALMERAGQATVEAIYDNYPALRPRHGLRRLLSGGQEARKAIVMCGPGNNGGDGFVIARLLRQEGWQVTAYFFGDVERLPVDARQMYDRWAALGDTKPLSLAVASPQRLADLYAPPPDLWVDALFGIGLNRPLPEDVTAFLHRVYYEQNWCTAPVVAVDVISGLDADTGRSVQPFHLTADLTVTFHAAKTGHLIKDGPARSGKVVVQDIGL